MFIGFGAVVNCAGIVAGGLAGMLFRSQISHALQENLIRAMGLVCLFLGICGVVGTRVFVCGDSRGGDSRKRYGVCPVFGARNDGSGDQQFVARELHDDFLHRCERHLG